MGTTLKQATDRQKIMAVRYKELFGSEGGQAVLDDLMVFCNANKSSVNEQSPDPSMTMFNEGKRRVYLRIKWYLDTEVE